MKHSWWVVMGLAVACGGGGGKKTPDAAVDAPKQVDAPADAAQMVSAALSHTLYVNTEGQAVTPGQDDATANTSTIPTQASTLTSWLAADAARQTKIDSLVAELTAIFAPYHISVVTTRPAAGPYDMVIVTDSAPTAIQLQQGVIAVTPTACNSTPSVIAFHFPLGGTVDANAIHLFARNIVAMFGIENGIPGSNAAADCMCLAGSACFAGVTAQCTIGGAGTPIDMQATCGIKGTTMNEGALFLEAFGPH